MKNKMTHLRNHLFETIEMLRDKEHPLDIPRARAISNAAQVILNSAKLELEFIKTTGERETGEFFDGLGPVKEINAAGNEKRKLLIAPLKESA
jgi:hypothetical protein